MLSKQLFRFLVIGIIGTFADWCVYNFLMQFIPIPVAKGCSFVVGSCIAFILNKVWTFENKESVRVQIVKFAILYIGTLFVNIGVNNLVLSVAVDQHELAFLIATGIHTCVNFCGQKFWVFKSIKES